MTWACTGCDDATKPIRSHIIEEKSKDVKAILSVYEEFTVLSFRYTATVKNFFQDIIFTIQVFVFNIRRLKISMLQQAVKFKRNMIGCGIRLKRKLLMI